MARACKYWITKLYCPRTTRLTLKAGIALILFANLIFVARYLAIELGYYENILIQNLIIYPGGILFAALVISLVLMLAFDSARLIKKAAVMPAVLRFFMKAGKPAAKPKEKGFDPGRRRFLKTAGMAAAAAPFGIAIGTASATVRDYQIVRKDIFFDHLPSGLEGLKIAQISDIHSGIYMTQRQIHEIFEITNSLHPNVVAITGDFVDTSKNEIPALYNSVNSLKSDYGAFGCLGNHDHYASGAAVSDAMEERGINMLVNGNNSLQINGENLAMIGVDDFGSGRNNHARLDNAMHNLNQDSFKILLSHRPELFDTAQNEGIDLTLSGHTHGGQIGMDILGIPLYPIKLLYNYTNGLYRQGDKKLYVNVGVGMVGIPIRMVRPEISLLTLRQTKQGQA